MSQSRISQGLLIAVVLAACSRPYQRAFDSPVLELRSSAQATQDAITVIIEPITRENLIDFSELGRAAMWREPDPNSQHPIGAPPYRVQWMNRIATVALVPFPAFHVTVENRSQRPLSFGSRTELIDDLQRPYRPIPDIASLKIRLARDMFGTSTYLAQEAPLMRSFSEAIDELTILTPLVSIAPGANWVGYLFFETGAIGADDYNVWMSSISSFTLRLNSSIETDPGFVFNFDKRNRPVTLTCPSHVKVPALERCSRLTP